MTPYSLALSNTFSKVLLNSSLSFPPRIMSSLWFIHRGMSPNIWNITWLNTSSDDFAPNINRFGLYFPQGVLNVANFRISSLIDSWWYPAFRSILQNTLVVYDVFDDR